MWKWLRRILFYNRALLLVWYEPSGPVAVRKHIDNLVKYSDCTIDVFNTYDLIWDPPQWMANQNAMSFGQLSLDGYDALIFHNTLSYTIDNLDLVERTFATSFRYFAGVKVLMKQDEMRQVNKTKDFIERAKIDLVLTCLDPSEAPKVYGEKTHAKMLQVLTGYVDDEMLERPVKPLAERDIDVFYRGMQTPFEWGSLGQEKYEIGEKFKAKTQGLGLREDISSRNEDRIYGEAWFERMAQSRTVLAVESGASIFDFDGEVEAWCAKQRQEHPQMTFDEAFRQFLHKYDGLVKYNQISPRHLEAACLGSVLVMYEGEYSGILRAGEHYISLKKDFSNLSEVVRAIRDDAVLMRIQKACLKLVCEDERLHVRHFVREFDKAMSQSV